MATPCIHSEKQTLPDMIVGWSAVVEHDAGALQILAGLSGLMIFSNNSGCSVLGGVFGVEEAVDVVSFPCVCGEVEAC